MKTQTFTQTPSEEFNFYRRKIKTVNERLHPASLCTGRKGTGLRPGPDLDPSLQNKDLYLNHSGGFICCRNFSGSHADHQILIYNLDSEFLYQISEE